MAEYNTMEMMIILASRQLEDDASIAVGTGAPCAAAMLAQRLYAPGLVIFFEAGGIDPKLPEMPISVGDSRTTWKAARAGSMNDIMEACSRGMVDYTFLGGAQIDRYGNLNSTIIGDDYDAPKVRLPGSGGANDFASFCWKMMVITPQDKRRFVEKLDFITTPGWLEGGDSRRRAGLPAGTGPYRIITDMAVMGFEKESRRMMVEALNPGCSREDVQENCGFQLLWSDNLQAAEPPTPEELRVLRDEIDPYRYLIGRA